MMAMTTRNKRTEVTRQAIRDAARRLFAEQGFAGTSVHQLAAEAGVALRTIYLAFGSKQGVLIDLVLTIGLDAGLADEAPNFSAEVTDPRQLIGAMARYRRNLYERGSDVIAMLREGAAAEPELKAALELGLGTSRAAFQGLCMRLQALGALRPGTDIDEAAGHALVLASDDGHDELVRRRGWSYDRYERWLTSALEEALLGTPPIGGSSRSREAPPRARRRTSGRGRATA
jgi:AcrR family transcriptional regulator